jgi:outer membrane protein with beta-barrel domain
MRRTAGVLALCVVALALPAAAAAGGLDVRLGAKWPSADSILFDDDEELYFVSDGDWVGFTGGAEYSIKAADNLEIGFHIDGYGKHVDTAYRDFVRDDGSDIRQTLELDVVPIGATLRLIPTSRRAKIAPFLGVGGDLVVYEYKEYGDFIDFFDPAFPVAFDSFQSDGVTVGVHATAGLRVFVSDDVAVVGEARYLWARDDMDDDFRGLRVDLGGISATLGVHIRF